MPSAPPQPYLDHSAANTRQQIRRSMRLYERRGKLGGARRDGRRALATSKG